METQVYCLAVSVAGAEVSVAFLAVFLWWCFLAFLALGVVFLAVEAAAVLAVGAEIWAGIPVVNRPVIRVVVSFFMVNSSIDQ